jgi:hypothetical protein
MLMLSGGMIEEITKSTGRGKAVEWTASDLHKSQYKRVF